MLLPLKDLVRKHDLCITGVLHVGAHEGEENDAYLNQGVPQSNIHWIEANPSLCARLSKRLPNVIQAAVSDTVGQVTFHVTNNFQSSSILELKEHLVEHPHIHTIETLQLSTTTLDSLVDTYSIRANFLNMDIQGAEGKCLKGFEKHISMVDYVYTEVNTKELYAGCALLVEMDAWLGAHGFERKELSMTHHGWGDAFYIRRQKPQWLLVDTDNHRKNRDGMIRMCADGGVDLLISQDPSVFGRQWEVVYIPSTFIDPSLFPSTAKIVYGPHNFVFVDGVWKQGNGSFPSNCVYNVLSEWVDKLEKEFGGIAMPTRTLPFPIDTHRFCPSPTTPKTLDCFVYFKHRHSYDLSLVLREVQKRNLRYKVLRYGSYSEEEFLSTVRDSAFGIWVGSHESQGFAFEEALACDTPLLVWNSTSMFDEHEQDMQLYADKKDTHKLLATTHPYWDDSCGISFIDRESISECLDRMVQTHTQFHPRAYITATLSAGACMDRFVGGLGLERQDIFVITSVIYTGQKPWSYTVRSVYSPDERFEQTLETIASIRLRAPRAKILLAEGSQVTDEQRARFEEVVDIFLSLSQNTDVRLACLDSEKKGFGEAVLTRYALNYVRQHKVPFERMFKISGRYALNNAFVSSDFSRSQFTFKSSPTETSISTVLFSIPRGHINTFSTIIDDTIAYYNTHAPTGYETIVPQKCIPRSDIPVVGAQGYVAVNRGELIIV